MIGWDACTQDPHWIVRQIECHPGSAGWAQAVGTVLAIGFAVWLGWEQMREARRREKENRAIKARAVALLFMPRLAEVTEEKTRISAVIADHDHGLSIITPVIITRQKAVFAMSFRLSSADDLMMRTEELPGEAAYAILKLFAFIDKFNNLIADRLPEQRQIDQAARAAYIAATDSLFAAIKKQIHEASRLLSAAASLDVGV